MQRYAGVEGFLLAGGDSSRMGRDKCLLELGGVPILLRIVRLVEPQVARVTVVGPVDRYAQFGCRVIPDEREGLGPLGGIYTALRNSAGEWNLVLACDLPYLSLEWLDYLLRRADASSADALLPQTVRGPEPLCAMYRTRCGLAIKAALDRGVRKVSDGLAGLQIEAVLPEEWKPFDSEGRLFKNMNAPADYEEVRASFESGKP